MPFQLDSSMYYTYILLSSKDGEWYTGASMIGESPVGKPRQKMSEARTHLQYRLDSSYFEPLG